MQVPATRQWRCRLCAWQADSGREGALASSHQYAHHVAAVPAFIWAALFKLTQYLILNRTYHEHTQTLPMKKTAGFRPPLLSRWMPGSRLGRGFAGHASPAMTTGISYQGTTAASGSATDASASAAPSPRSVEYALSSPRTADRLLPGCGRCSCQCRSACGARVLRGG